MGRWFRKNACPFLLHGHETRRIAAELQTPMGVKMNTSPVASDAEATLRRSVEDAYERWRSVAEALDGQYALQLARAGAFTQSESSSLSAAELYEEYVQQRQEARQAWVQAMDTAESVFRAATGLSEVPEVSDDVAEVPDLLSAPEGGVVRKQEAPTPDLPVTQRRRLIVALSCGLALLLVAVALYIWFPGPAQSKASSSTQPDANSSSFGGTVDVLYEVEGTAKGTNLTLESGTGTLQLNGKAVPLANKSTGKRGITATMSRGAFVYISAQNTGDTGTITCRISVDGVVISSNTSSGGYAIASCKGTAR